MLGVKVPLSAFSGTAFTGTLGHTVVCTSLSLGLLAGKWGLCTLLFSFAMLKPPSSFFYCVDGTGFAQFHAHSHFTTFMTAIILSIFFLTSFNSSKSTFLISICLYITSHFHGKIWNLLFLLIWQIFKKKSWEFLLL